MEVRKSWEWEETERKNQPERKEGFTMLKGGKDGKGYTIDGLSCRAQ